MRYSYRVVLGGVLVASALAGQTAAASIPSTAEVANFTLAAIYQHSDIQQSYIIRNSNVLGKRNVAVTMLSANAGAPDFAAIFHDEAEMRRSSVYNSAVGTADTVMPIHNNEGETIGIWLERNNQKVLMPGGEHLNYIMIPSGAWALLRMPIAGGYRGTMRAFGGCDESGFDCFGPSNAATLLEWNVDAGSDGAWWVDISLVRGYNLAMEVSGAGPGNTCEPLSCNIPRETVHQLCPDANKVAWGGHVMCKSDCALAEDPRFCCPQGGQFEKPNCRESNLHLKPVCNHYSWAHDDKHTHKCHPGGIMNVEIGRP